MHKDYDTIDRYLSITYYVITNCINHLDAYHLQVEH